MVITRLRFQILKGFFTNLIAGQEFYCTYHLQELFLSRITQPISNYLANAKFSYAEVDSNIEKIAQDAQQKSESVFNDLGFELTDFRIEGTSFDEETNQRIGEISNVQADVQAANIAGVDFAELQKLKAMRDAAKNEGAAGASMGLLAGMNMGGNMMQPSNENQSNTNQKTDVRTKLKELKELFEDELISEEEYQTKKQQLLSEL